MADSVKLYTTGNMKAAIMASAPDAATGYPVTNILDNNPDTWWKSSDGTANRDLEIDLGSAKTVDALIVWVHNYTAMTNARGIELSYSDDDSTYTFISGSSALVDTAGPIRIRTSGLPTASPHRYWRIRINADAGGQIPEISGVWLCQLFSPSVGNQYPEPDEDVAYNRYEESESGRAFVAGINSQPGVEFTRQFAFYSAADATELRNAWLDCIGRRYPLFLHEDTTQTNAVFCRFMEDRYNRARMGYLEYRPTVRFKSIPWIPAGEVF